jgi:RimJ/RimL family protein N-acetyltransferase/N-acetylglutamate synthase-like GNAT family acetyltransferase
VKLADLADNLANNRRLAQTDETRERVGRYRRARARLLAVDAGPPTILHTERLVLRDYDEDDFDAVHALKSDPEVLRHTDEEPLDREGARAWLQDAIAHNRVRPRRAYNLALVVRATGEVVGWLGFGPPTRSHGPDEYDFGYQLVRRHWGKGYATEAAQRIVRFAFEELGAHRVYAECDPANAAAARVIEKAGLVREAHFRQRDLRKGAWCDALQYAILADEWRAASQAADELAEAYLVRPGAADDVARVAELSRRWAAEGITTGYLPDAEATLAGRLGPYWLVGERDGRVVGYAVGAVRESEGLAVLPAGVRYLEVEDLYVEPEHRSRGLGGALLGRLLGEAAGRGVERALVYSSNRAWERTAAFYGRHGFRMWFIRMVR